MEACFKLISLATLCLVLASNCANGGSAASRNRHNLFDPIYAYDDVDAHTVTAAQANNVAQQDESGSQKQVDQRQLLEGSGKSIESVLQAATNNRKPKAQVVNYSSSTGPALVAPAFSLPLEPSGTTTHSKREEKAAPRHWSALENYYQKLRQSQQQMTSQANNPQPSSRLDSALMQQILYQLPQQEVEEPLASYRPITSYESNYPIISNLDSRALPQAVNKNQAPFLLPLRTSGGGTGAAVRSASLDELALMNAPGGGDYTFTTSVHRNSAPGISRLGGIGSGSLVSGGGSGSGRPGSSPERWDHETQANGRDMQPAANANTGPIFEGGKLRYREWHKLPDLLLIQQQQQRAKHQFETLPGWYDQPEQNEPRRPQSAQLQDGQSVPPSRSLPELVLQEEAYCGPRNYINFEFVPLTSLQRTDRPSGVKQAPADTVQLNPMQLLQLQLDGEQFGTRIGRNVVEVPVTFSAGEYPSHAGLYNGSLEEKNFICGATWVSDWYVLTLASCVDGFEPKKLTVRLGEWNIMNPNGNTSAVFTRQVDQKFIFPKYRNGSTDHNLALLRLNKPLDYLKVPYVSPACQQTYAQPQRGSSVRSGSCWAPVRNITVTEYFDADGEGETKERRSVNMVELPVRLITDDIECRKQTKLDFFHFQHPNYLCSGHYSLSWRAQLNRTEHFGSGIYCNEGGNLNLVSLVHTIQPNSSSANGYLDLSYYKPWMRYIMSGRTNY